MFVSSALFLLLNLKIIWEGIKKIHADTALTYAAFTVPLLGIIALKNWHLYWLLHFGVSRIIVHKLYMLGSFENFLWLFVLITTFTLWVIGIGAYFKKRKIENALSRAHLKNSFGDTPKVIARFDESEYREIIRLRAPGIGAEKMLSQQSAIESAIGYEIEDIRPYKDRSYTDLVIVKKDLPTMYQYESLTLLPNGAHFRVGKSKEGNLLGNIATYPHMLIAGTTGGGKSLFFKQALLGLLESTEKLQMYLIDLKAGLEMRPFSELPNVKMTKTTEDAVELLREVKKEMERRFSYLEKKKSLRIEPGFDPFDRIVVGIDEASVLYTGCSRDDDDYELMQEARFLTEHIAKLSRAAAIHLVLATQKVTKETIDTRIQENMSAKMCFKLNTIEGSVRVLGHGKAHELPSIPGRGIWQTGIQEEVVQVPYLDQSVLEGKLESIKLEIENGTRKLHQPMLLEKKPSKPFWLDGDSAAEVQNEG